MEGALSIQGGVLEFLMMRVTEKVAFKYCPVGNEVDPCSQLENWKTFTVEA